MCSQNCGSRSGVRLADSRSSLPLLPPNRSERRADGIAGRKGTYRLFPFYQRDKMPVPRTIAFVDLLTELLEVRRRCVWRLGRPSLRRMRQYRIGSSPNDQRAALKTFLPTDREIQEGTMTIRAGIRLQKRTPSSICSRPSQSAISKPFSTSCDRCEAEPLLWPHRVIHSRRW